MSADLRERLRTRFRGYSGARPDVLRLIPHNARRILDVGCGAGGMGSLLRERRVIQEIVGIEPDPALAAEARKQGVRVIEGSFGDALIHRAAHELGPFDAVLLADVLEHLAEPEAALSAARRLVASDGCIVTSIPNVRHVSTFIALGFGGYWPRRDRGIHDRDHLRWFTRADILALGRAAGLTPEQEARNLRLFESRAWSMVPAKALDFWPFRGFLTFQYLHRWVLENGSASAR